MKLNKEDRKLAVRMLLEVRRLISEKQEYYICFALNTIISKRTFFNDGNRPFFVRTYLKKWIDKMLSPHGSLDNWQLAQCGTRADLLHLPHHTDGYSEAQTNAFRAARLQWIDWMISELERP